MEKVRLTDEEILVQIKQGNIDYYAHIVKHYTTRIFVFVNSHLFDKGETEDLVQNIFIAFYKAIDRFDEKRPVLPYLYEIAKNELKMYYRSRRETVPLNENTAKGVPASGNVTEPDLAELLHSVSPDQKQALEMVYEGYSYREIADRLNKNINTVRTLIRRARLLLIARHKNEKS